MIVVAVVLRVGSALYQGNSMDALPGVHDQISYDGLAKRVLGGHGFSFAEDHWPATRGGEPTAHWSFLYTLYLSAVYGVFGAQPVAARVIQAIIAGILHTWLTWRIGGRLFGRTVGAVAAGLAAVYIYFVYYSGALITETFYVVAVLWTLDCLMRFPFRADKDTGDGAHLPKYRSLWVELGLAFGVTILLRQLFLLFAPFMILWLWWAFWRVRGDGNGSDGLRLWSILAGTALSLAIVAALIVPWTVRNYRAFDTFVPLNTNSGFAFYWGNHPYHGTSFVPILPDDGPSYIDLIPPELLHLNEAELDSALLKEGINFVLDDPGRYALLSVSRAREYFKFWPSPDSGFISNVARVASFGLLLPFMVYGLWVAFGVLRRPITRGQQSAIVLLMGFCLGYTGIHLLTWTLIRYRIPVDAVLVVFAALGIVDLVWRIRGRNRVSSESSEDVAPAWYPA